MLLNCILTAAKRHQAPQEEMPFRIYIVSDMEFVKKSGNFAMPKKHIKC